MGRQCSECQRCRQPETIFKYVRTYCEQLIKIKVGLQCVALTDDDTDGKVLIRMSFCSVARLFHQKPDTNKTAKYSQDQ